MNSLTPRRMALVGCGKEKLPHAAPARELYTGPLFRAALAVAEAEFGADVWILSAKHGLVDLDENVAPYDLALGALSATERAAWALDVIRNLTDDDHGSPAHLTAFAGAPYVDALRAHLPRGWSLEDPLAGLSQGQRLAWLKARLAQLSSASNPLTTALAGSSDSAPKESAMPATRLTHEQREQYFARGLALESALAEVPAIRERFLAALAQQEQTLRTLLTRAMAAATTGEDPDARDEQQALPLDAPTSAPTTLQERSKDAPKKDEQPAPEPPKGARRPRRRPATEAKGQKRAGKAASARTVAEASAAPEGGEDAVPAPAIPCCTCGDSVADHQDGHGAIGACHAKKCAATPRCKAFQLGQVHGWTLRWLGGWKETNDKPVFFLAPPGAPSIAMTFGPLFLHEGSLYSSDPTHPERLSDALAEARQQGSWKAGLPVERGVPLRVLEVVARVLAESSPAAPAAPVSAREKYLAETRELNPHLSENEVAQYVDNYLKGGGSALSAPPEFAGLDATALLDAHLGAREEGREYKDELKVMGTDCACWSCGTRTGPRASLSFGRAQRPRGAKTWRADKDARCSAHWFTLWLCSRCCTPEVLAEKRQARERERQEARQKKGDDTPSECDGCTREFPASQLQPVGGEATRGFYCKKCREEISNTSPTPAAPVAPVPVDGWGRPWPTVDAALFPGWYVHVCPGFCGKPGSLSAGRLHELFLWVDVSGPEGQRIKSLGWFPAAQGGPAVQRTGLTTPAGALATLLPAGLEAALVAYLSAHWPLPEEMKHPKGALATTSTKKARARTKARGPRTDEPGTSSTPAQLELESDSAPEAGVPLNSVNLEEVTDLREVLRLLKGSHANGPRGARLLHMVSALALSAREETWSHLAGHEPWIVVLHPTATRGEVWLSYDRRALGTAGPWLWDGKTLTRAEDWAAPRKGHTKGESAEEALRALEPALRAALATPEESPAPSAQEDAGGTWRVELPKRFEGRGLIVPVWLVNDALGERRAASWWGRSGLKASHHSAGTLRGAELEEYVALQAWWKEHAETVKPLEQACRDGAVPGLRVGVPADMLADGPFFYALSGGWRLEMWEPNEGEPHAFFSQNGTARHGPFAWEKGWLVASEVAAISWAQGAAHVVREAEDFIARGFVHELRSGEDGR